MRRKAGYGPRRLTCHLAQEGISISVHGVYCAIQGAGLVSNNSAGYAARARVRLELHAASRRTRRQRLGSIHS